MRHTKEQLIEVFAPVAQQITDALSAAILITVEKNGPGILARLKRALFSHHVRSEVFDYLQRNPLPGFELIEKKHRNNQSVFLVHSASGLEIKLVRLSDPSSEPINEPITGVDDDPALSVPMLELQMEDAAGMVGLSWKTPHIDDDGVPHDVEITVVRAASGSTIISGQVCHADCVFPLPVAETDLPEASFDPNASSYTFRVESEGTTDD